MTFSAISNEAIASSIADTKTISSANENNNTTTTKRRYISWGRYKSTDKSQPDLLEVKVQQLDTFEDRYSTSTNVSWKDENSGWVDAILPLKSHSSRNVSLLKQWQDAIKRGRIKKGTHIKILTWLDTSKNGNPIRRFRLVIG